MFKLFLLLFLPSLGYSNELSLKNELLTDYRNDIKPPQNGTIELELGMALRALNNINQIDGTLDMNVWLRYWWNDNRLIWNASEWNNMEKLNFFTDLDSDYSIWTPDIYLYNTAENPLEQLDHSMSMVYSDGSVIWSRPGMIKSTCEFKLADFPYDTQNCFLKFGSWSYHKDEMNLSLPKINTLDISNFQPNQGWDLTDWSSIIEEKKYACCPETYQTLIINLELKRDPSYYVLNIIIPTFATASLMILSLIIPWDSGERISFAVTVMLSIIVFLLILSENLPKTKTKPLLSRMLVGLVFFSLFVVFFTIIISFMHSKKKMKLCVPSKEEGEQEDEEEQAAGQLEPVQQTIFPQVRSRSYIETIMGVNNTQKRDDKKEDCDTLANKIERIFTVVFFVGFVVYTVCIFSYK